MSTFTPIAALSGGTIIGLASTTLLLLNGDIMGASGIVSSIVNHPRRTWETQSWKIIFTASFIGAANLYINFADPNALQESGSGRKLSIIGYLSTGLLIGFGTKLGNGCTSGHGICGLPRLSRRSFAAVCTFMGMGMATATLFSSEAVQSRTSYLFADISPPNAPNVLVSTLVGVVPMSMALFSTFVIRSNKTLGAAISGAFFAVGLAVSKMVVPSKVLGFLDLSGFSSGSYDPSLALVMAGGVVTSFLGYWYRQQHCVVKPILADEYNIPCNTVIDTPLLLGASIFGIGWGFGGLCPGPALFWAAVGSPAIAFLWMPTFFAGSYLGSKVQDYLSTPCNAVALNSGSEDVSTSLIGADSHDDGDTVGAKPDYMAVPN
ncbi:hypothetical protein MHU86_10984 [Fragilaria crotonensis]|nr:hypothetical protein MHU86_10984 [Fragilaria crotonensis]